MYQQETCFSAANTPLFAQIFGSSSTTATPRETPYIDNYAHPRNKSRNQTSSSPTHRVVRENNPALAIFPSTIITTTTTTSSDNSTSVAAGDRCKEEEVSHPAVHDGDVSIHENTCDKIDADSVEESTLHTSKQPALPFREVMRELERRFGEQMEVHRGLNTAMRQLDLLKGEISLYQSEQRTTQLALMIQQSTRTSFQDAASANAAIAAATATANAISTNTTNIGTLQRNQTTNNTTSNTTTNSNANANAKATTSTSTSSSAATTSPFLQQVLESYARERAGAKHGITVQSPPKIEKPQKPPIEVIRPPEEPKPYKRVYFVPVEKQQDSVSESTFSDRKYSTNTFSSSSSSFPPPAVASVSTTEMSYTDSFESSGGVSTDISVSLASQNSSRISSSIISSSSSSSSRSSNSSNSNSSMLSSTSSITDLTETVAPSSTVKGMSVIRTQQKTGHVDVDDAPLLAGLREFHRACNSANRLLQMVLGSNGDVRKYWRKGDVDKRSDTGSSVKQQRLMDKVKNDGTGKEKDDDMNNDNDDGDAWLISLQRDVADVRKLRSFVNHLRNNIKAMDYQSKLQKARQSLLRKAQRLAKARRRMQREKSTLSDVMDDIADLIQSDSIKGNGSDVIDDVATVASLSWGSQIDSVEDVIDDDIDNVYDAVDDSNDDIIMDEVSNVMERSDIIDDEVLDELQEPMTAGGGGDDDDSNNVEDIMSEFPSGMNLSRAESEFANILAEASDINDIIEDEVPLPSNSVSVVEEEDIIIPSSDSPSAADVISTDDEIIEEDGGVVHTSAVESVSEEEIPTSFTEVMDSQDADVSSVFPASTASEKCEMRPAYQTIEAAICDESDSAESALSALESEIEKTRKRRTMALSNVHPQTFTALYSPAAVPNNNNNNNNNSEDNDMDNVSESYEDAEVHTRKTGSTTTVEERKHSYITEGEKEDHVSLPVVVEETSRKNILLSTSPTDKRLSASVNETLLGVTPATDKNTDVKMYAADDLLSQLEWKERQLALFRELRLTSEANDMGDKPIPDENEIPLKERSEYHWGMVETLLQCRFGSAAEVVSSGDDIFSYDEISYSDSSEYDDYDDDDDREDSDDSIRETFSHDGDHNKDNRTNVLQSM
ncbi:putative RNA-binding protein [Trypanosoma theileri]|uniref:Putative RNA-binding protein n=1 Tax=Trypanosoma theileri TaxID=67003 RepID=A0A1X0P538_9TRYP|nr:putative RNA-binding protein [Trypanosoma theileri]ORC91763.1 putative RNA-binding protein [Trypanosoma theileri]